MTNSSPVLFEYTVVNALNSFLIVPSIALLILGVVLLVFGLGSAYLDDDGYEGFIFLGMLITVAGFIFLLVTTGGTSQAGTESAFKEHGLTAISGIEKPGIQFAVRSDDSRTLVCSITDLRRDNMYSARCE